MKAAKWRRPAVVGLLTSFVAGAALLASAQAPDRREQDAIDPAGIAGALVIVGSNPAAESAVARFVELAGGEKARLGVVLPDGADEAEALKPWRDRALAGLAALKAAGTPPRDTTGIWLDARFTPAAGSTWPAILRDVLGAKGVVATANSALAEALIPDVSLRLNFDRDKDLAPWLEELKKSTGRFGIGIGPGAALAVRGREMRVLGDGVVTIALAASPRREPRSYDLKSGRLADYTQLRRAARARAQEKPQPEPPGPSEVAGPGALVIVGGGGMPADVTQKFLELAGGPEALIAVLPTAVPDPIPANADAGFLRRAGAKNVKTLPARIRAEVEAPENLQVLKQAKGVWFGGGRQWRFVDAYEGTKAQELFREVLERGGVIGGSSAGATIQGEYLCRGSPLGNTEMMCEGYERGLGFLPGVAIDQHFTQRNRFGDMAVLMKAYPQYLGIGIDEATALIVRGQVAEVMGRGQVHFFTRPMSDHQSVAAGGRYDLKTRRLLSAGPNGR